MRIITNFGKLLTALAAVTLAWISVSTTVAVVSRQFGGNPYSWTLETGEYGLLLVTLFPLATLVVAREQIQVTILNEETAPRLIKPLNKLADISGLLISVLFLAACIYVSFDSFGTGQRITGVLRIHRWQVALIMAIAASAWAAAHLSLLLPRKAESQADDTNFPRVNE